jgi:hypothetical protein
LLKNEVRDADPIKDALLMGDGIHDVGIGPDSGVGLTGVVGNEEIVMVLFG